MRIYLLFRACLNMVDKCYKTFTFCEFPYGFAAWHTKLKMDLLKTKELAFFEIKFLFDRVDSIFENGKTFLTELSSLKMYKFPYF